MYRLVDNDDYASTKYGNKFKVFGKGILSVKPDAAEVIIGVITENTQLEVAQGASIVNLNATLPIPN